MTRRSINREFIVPQHQCDHPERFNEPSRLDYLWKRCAQCGLILDECQRCPQRNRDGSRCLAVVADGYDTCYSHSHPKPPPPFITHSLGPDTEPE